MKTKPKFVSLLIVGVILTLLAAFLLYIRQISSAVSALLSALNPFLWAFVLAYLLDQPMQLAERLLKKIGFKRNKFIRTAAVCIVVLLVFAVMIGLGYIILPQLIRNLLGIIERLPDYYSSAVTFLCGLAERLHLNFLDLTEFDFETVLNSLYIRLSEISGNLAAKGISLLSDTVDMVTNLSVAFISGIYLLIFKEHFIAGLKKVLFSFLPTSPTERMIDLLRDSNRIFIGYLYSKLITSLIIGVLTFAAMLVFRLPYSPLISAIMTIFNLIPFFGPFLGAIPSVLLLLIDDPYYALIFILITIFVQFLDNQFLTPKIVGDSIGINPFWVLFSIVLGGFFGGIAGMFFGVPLFAVLLAVFRAFVNSRLRSKGLSSKTEDYHTHNIRK